MRKQPNYLYLTISLITAVVVVTFAPPLSALSLAGVFTGAVSFLVTACILIERKHQLLLAVLLAASRFYRSSGSVSIQQSLLFAFMR